jgi:hypothetical protein
MKNKTKLTFLIFWLIAINLSATSICLSSVKQLHDHYDIIVEFKVDDIKTLGVRKPDFFTHLKEVNLIEIKASIQKEIKYNDKKKKQFFLFETTNEKLIKGASYLAFIKIKNNKLYIAYIDNKKSENYSYYKWVKTSEKYELKEFNGSYQDFLKELLKIKSKKAEQED